MDKPTITQSSKDKSITIDHKGLTIFVDYTSDPEVNLTVTCDKTSQLKVRPMNRRLFVTVARA